MRSGPKGDWVLFTGEAFNPVLESGGLEVLEEGLFVLCELRGFLLGGHRCGSSICDSANVRPIVATIFSRNYEAVKPLK